MATLERNIGKAGTAVVTLKNTDGADHTADQAHVPGGANETQPQLSYVRIVDKSNALVVDVQTTMTIGAGGTNDTYLKGLEIVKALTGTVVVTGFVGDGGVAASITYDAGSVGSKDFKGALNAAGPLTITASNIADANKVTVFWWAA